MSATETAPTPSLADPLVRALPGSSRALATLIERLRANFGAYALHETVSAARPFVAAATHRALGGQMLVVVPTADAAERTFADLLYYLGEPEGKTVCLFRSRDETIGTIESPSERSARMSLLAELLRGEERVVVAPVAAVRQYIVPRAQFEALRFTLRKAEEAGWEAVQTRLYRLGYHRVDVVSAAGEYAVRGGILDLFAASADTPVRLEFFGDTIDSIRPFNLESQRSDGDLEQLEVVPWSEIPRDQTLRESLSGRYQGEDAVRSALQTFLASGRDIPEAWVSLATDTQDTIFEYFEERAIIVLEEPSMLRTIERALEEERAREEHVLLAGVDSGEMDVDAHEVGEALLAEVAAPHPSLHDLTAHLARRRVLVIPGAIENPDDQAWLPRIVENAVLESRPAEHFNRQMELLLQTLRDWVEAGDTVVLVSSGAARTAEIIRGAGLSVERGAHFIHLRANVALGTDGASLGAPARKGTIYIDQGNIEAGFGIPDLRLRVLGDRELYGQPPKRVKIRAVKEGVPVTLADLRVGDYVVHAVHGIGQYLGLRTEKILGVTQDYLDLRYAGTDRMLVPVTQMHQVTKYGASEGGTPRLSKMGGADWARTKGRVSEQLAKIAEGLVELYAEREMARGHEYPPDTPWQAELEEAFPYDETPDQLKAILDTKADMERQRPMDRLVCGDVGYGKTEVAVRAAFKAIADKKQVAVLVPTTLLAAQHHRTFNSRLAGFPVRIEELSRFKTRKEQQETLRDLADGKVDIVVGTHRLLQKDVTFKDLGLIIVDEEQRFGVMHKERLKQMRASVDVLTLSATPIPRTLHMSLMGVRDLSLIQTAPRNRMSIKTIVVPAGDAIVQRAITAEIDRGGQVYYVHNRIESIYAVANALQQLVPKARITVGHGQMTEGELEPVMTKFIEGEIDVFVSTTIIENGIDIPNVNTIIINDADKFGLSQLYQLRGRVGRSNHQAYAYLLYQAHKALSEDAKARLEAIREFTHLGSGLQVAMRDLEIRGAGNLLGAAQSGFIGAVGFDTYCQLLAEAIAKRKGEAMDLDRREAVIDVKIDAFVPNDYIPQVSQKIAVYQQLANAKSLAQVEEIAAGVRDRFGKMPEPLVNLVEIMKLRTIALAKNVTRVVVDELRLTLGVGTHFALQPSAIPKLQSLTKNKFRFAEGKIVVDLPGKSKGEWMPLLRALLEAM
ncbi:MAG: transcription-repair coupling factor [Candidatus Eremiobacteraeota bacterium]|nr:transcription-repair coupling factor [Candidatus Eremiobacteraeota bacterium]